MRNSAHGIGNFGEGGMGFSIDAGALLTGLETTATQDLNNLIGSTVANTPGAATVIQAQAQTSAGNAIGAWVIANWMYLLGGAAALTVGLVLLGKRK